MFHRLRSPLLLALLAAGVMTAPLAEAAAKPRPVVIGYLPTFKDYKGAMAATDLSKLTHINIAFLNPDPQGNLVAGDVMTCMTNNLHVPLPGQDVRDIVTQAHAAHVKVLASMGGGQIPACAGDWATLLSPASRPNLIKNILQYVKDYDLDGIDIDLEWEVMTKIDTDGDYVPFVTELGAALHAEHKILSCATASHPGGMIPAASIPAFDYVNIMSYDEVGPSWGTSGGEHASLAEARADIATWQAQGLPKSKLVLGLPFYGYGFNGYNRGYDYKNILTTFGEDAAEGDVIGKLCAGCQYITYNGRPTIRAKATLAAQDGAGIMIWELSADAPGADSLLDAAYESVNAPGDQ